MANDTKSNQTLKKQAIIIGASSGIGAALAHILVQDGYQVTVAARREELLNTLKSSYPEQIHVQTIDMAAIDTARQVLTELLANMQYVDLIIYAAGVGDINIALHWEKEKQTIDINVSGFTAVAGMALQYFQLQRHGHFAAISSIAALRGGRNAPAYNASKAYISNYLVGLRQKVTRLRLPIYITDIQPGFVDTAMAKGEDLFWVTPVNKAAQQIYRAIKTKKAHVYISKRWRIIAWLLKLLPGFLYHRC